MKLVNSLLSLFVIFVVYESKALAVALLIDRDDGRCNSTEFCEDFIELFLGDFQVNVLDIKISELRLLLIDFRLAFLFDDYKHRKNYGRGSTYFAGDMVSNIDLLIVQQHTIHSFDSGVGSLGSLVVNKSVPFGAADFIGGNFARQDISESSKRVVESFVVNLLVQVLDEDIALPGLAKSRVTLRPHNPAVGTLELSVFKGHLLTMLCF